MLSKEIHEFNNLIDNATLYLTEKEHIRKLI